MGTFDRKKPDATSDRSPLRNLLDFESINNTAQSEGGRIGSVFDRLAQLFGLTGILDLIDGTDDGVFDPGAVISNFFNTLIMPLAVFGDAIMEPIRNLVDGIVALVGPIPIVGPALANLANFLGLTHNTAGTAVDIGTAAQASADVANVGVARLEGQVASGNVPGGVQFDDTFDRSGSTLGANYDQVNTGPAGGTLSTDGNNCVLIPSGSGVTSCAARITTALATDYEAISVVQNNGVQNILNPGGFQFGLRVNAARTEGIIVTVGLNSVTLAKVVGGASTTLGTAGDYGAAGDKWTLKVGTNNDVREFIVIHNTSEIIKVTDTSGTLSVYGASNRYPYISQQSALQYIPPFFTGQVVPPGLQSVIAYDRLPAA